MKEKCKRFLNLLKRKYAVIIYWLIILALLGLYFTNDYGLVDIHKTSVIVAVGIDTADEEIQVTAQVAVPQPSQSGDNIQYTQIQGRGLTVADALNEINTKTGFYPKLLFCKLILIGEECQSEDLFRILGCFYRRNYSELTVLVAMCKGRAEEMLSMPATISPENTTAMQRALSDELKNSANASVTNLKEIAESNYSVSKACYMPFIEANVQGTSEAGGNGDNVGGESGGQQGGGSSGGESGGQQGGSSGGEGGEGGGGSSGGESSGQQGASSGGEQQMEFTARKTAVFSDGKFAGILDEQQSFALNILKNEIRLAVLPCDADDIHYTLGLKGASGGISLKVNKGVPELTVSFNATAQVQGVKKVLEPESVFHDDVVRPEVLKAAEEEIKSRMQKLIDLCAQENCDVLGVREKLHKYNYKYFDAFKDDILTRMQIKYEVKIKSLN